MPSFVRNILAVIAGILIGSVVNLGIIKVGPLVIPPPAGVDMADMENFAENLTRLKPANFIAPWLAHALGTLAGAYIASKVAVSHRMKLALGTGAFFLLGGSVMAAMSGGPLWFSVLDLAGAYIPMGYFGGVLGGAKTTRPQ
jgi:hypothetical protein